MLPDSLGSLRMPLSPLLSISINTPSRSGPYPTSKIQKGPVLAYGSTDLSGEGIGLGLPVVKIGHHVFFPGKARMTEQQKGSRLCEWIVDYELNLEERLTLKSGRNIRSNRVYAVTDKFAKLHKTVRISRGLIERANSVLRRIWGLGTTFEVVSSSGNVRVSYTIDTCENVLHVNVDASRLKAECEEMAILNEQDGSFFDRYYDANGLALLSKQIGTWEKTDAAWVMLIDPHHNIKLHFRNIIGSTMYRGREVVPGRLSWAGVAYVSAPPRTEFEYDIAIQEAL